MVWRAISSGRTTVACHASAKAGGRRVEERQPRWMNKAYAEDVLREGLIRDVVLNQERFALAVLVADGTELPHKVTGRV